MVDGLETVEKDDVPDILSRKKVAKILSEIREFKGFIRPQIARLAKQKVHYWGPNEFIIEEGSDGLDQMIIILAGTVYIHKLVKREDGERGYEQVAEIAGPSLLGENSFFTGLTRSAGVHARKRIPAIVLDRETFMGLVSLDRSTFLDFLRRIVTEEIGRIGQTVNHYMGTLQIILSKASQENSLFYHQLSELRRINLKNVTSIEPLEKHVFDALMLLRKLNIALEELYRFANLPEISVISIDSEKFRIEKSHRYYDLFVKITNDLKRTQELVPLETINTKDVVLSAVMEDQDLGLVTIDYPTIVGQALDVYRQFAKQSYWLGLKVNVFESKRTHEILSPNENDDLLWD